MRWTNLEVRKLLRLMRRPHALERERLAVLLREATQAGDARDALQRVIDGAFDGANPLDRLRLEIVRRCDIGGETTRVAARALHVSIRQFFRHRSDAIESISQSIERLLRRPPDSHNHLLGLARMIESIDPRAAHDVYRRIPDRDGEIAYNIVRTALWAGDEVTQQQIDSCCGPWRMLAHTALARRLVSRGETTRAAMLRDELRATLSEDLGPRYTAAVFELTFLDRCEACRRADSRESAALLERMRLLAGNNESLVALVMINEADQALLDGDLTAAAVALNDVELLDVHAGDLNIMARTALGKAMLSHVRGFHEEAFALANGAAPVIAALEGGFALRAAGIAGRAALMCGAHWVAPDELFEKYPRVWTKALTQAVVARHLLAADALAAKKSAEAALALAVHHAAPVLKAYAQVSLAGALDVLGDSRHAQALRIAGWRTALRHGDHFALYDLLCQPHAPQHDIGTMIVDDGFVRSLHEYVQEAVPAYAQHVQRVGSASVERLRETLRTIISDPLGGVAGVPHAHAQAAAPARLLGAAEDQAAAAAHAAALCLAPHERPHFEERFVRAWGDTTHLSETPSGQDEVARAG